MRPTEAEGAGKEHSECGNLLVSAETRLVPMLCSMAKMEDLRAAAFILLEKSLMTLPSLASTSGPKAVHATGGCVSSWQELR